MMSTSFGGMPIVLRMFQLEVPSRESKTALRSIWPVFNPDEWRVINAL